MEAAATVILILFWVFLVVAWVMFVLSFYFVMFGLAVSLLILWVLMLIDCIQRDFSKPDDKIVWILVVVLTGWIGALIYYFMVKRPADQSGDQSGDQPAGQR